MAGVFFNRYDGYLRVDFRNSPRRGDIEISFYVYGDTTATADCDDQFQVIQQEVTVAPDAILSCWTSSSSSYFFRSMRNWLEAVTRDVHECAFSWEGEGPDGELRWYGGVRESGMLKMSWTGGRDAPSFQHDVRLNKVQMVQALYQSFHCASTS